MWFGSLVQELVFMPGRGYFCLLCLRFLLRLCSWDYVLVLELRLDFCLFLIGVAVVSFRLVSGLV